MNLRNFLFEQLFEMQMIDLFIIIDKLRQQSLYLGLA